VFQQFPYPDIEIGAEFVNQGLWIMLQGIIIHCSNAIEPVVNISCSLTMADWDSAETLSGA